MWDLQLTTRDKNYVYLKRHASSQLPYHHSEYCHSNTQNVDCRDDQNNCRFLHQCTRWVHCILKQTNERRIFGKDRPWKRKVFLSILFCFSLSSKRFFSPRIFLDVSNNRYQLQDSDSRFKLIFLHEISRKFHLTISFANCHSMEIGKISWIRFINTKFETGIASNYIVKSTCYLFLPRSGAAEHLILSNDILLSNFPFLKLWSFSWIELIFNVLVFQRFSHNFTTFLCFYF